MAAAVWSVPDMNPYLKIPMDVIKQFVELPPPDPTTPGIFRLAKPGDLASLLQQSGFVGVTDQEFLSGVQFESAEQYFASLMDIAAPIQDLWTKLSPSQQGEAKQTIIQTAGHHRRGPTPSVALPIAVRMVAARKTL